MTPEARLRQLDQDLLDGDDHQKAILPSEGISGLLPRDLTRDCEVYGGIQSVNGVRVKRVASEAAA